MGREEKGMWMKAEGRRKVVNALGSKLQSENEKALKC